MEREEENAYDKKQIEIVTFIQIRFFIKDIFGSQMLYNRFYTLCNSIDETDFLFKEVMLVQFHS